MEKTKEIPKVIKDKIIDEANWRSTNGHGGVHEITRDNFILAAEYGYQLADQFRPSVKASEAAEETLNSSKSSSLRWVKVESESDLPTEDNNCWLTEWTHPSDTMVVFTDYCDKWEIAHHFNTPEIGGLRYLVEGKEADQAVKFAEWIEKNCEIVHDHYDTEDKSYPIKYFVLKGELSPRTCENLYSLFQNK